ncbi:hypothetical protein [Streptomyces sp. NPDC058855]|uniref:hypothetical protein n=1 Tax=Streptomyces sp. NPDC058855 TaxID=3346651 RepID=UPI0036758A7A
MADERYQWLDQEAAERLLRGEPVDAVDDRARSQAQRLAEALGTARTPSAAVPADAELPGEAAALAAFRKAVAERAALTGATAGSGAPSVPAGPVDLGRVRLTPVTVPARRWGRSVRYGLAAAVAAVTVGGVAVAAGTGVLPLVGPSPANSVTAAESPEPVVTETPGVRQDPGTPPPATPDRDGRTPGTPATGTPGTSPSAGGGHPDGGSGAASGGTSPGRTTGAPDGAGDHTGTDTGAGTGTSPGTDSTGGGTALPDTPLKACRDFRAGRLDEAGRRQLAGRLRSGETLSRYCDRILPVDTGTAGGGSGDAGGAGGPGGPGDTKDDGTGESKGDGKDDGAGDADEHRPGHGGGKGTGSGPRPGTDRDSDARDTTAGGSGGRAGSAPKNRS